MPPVDCFTCLYSSDISAALRLAHGSGRRFVPDSINAFHPLGARRRPQQPATGLLARGLPASRR
jgi:hypothetical protein